MRGFYLVSATGDYMSDCSYSVKVTKSGSLYHIDVICSNHGSNRFADVESTMVGQFLDGGQLAVILGQFPSDLFNDIVLGLHGAGAPDTERFLLN